MPQRINRLYRHVDCQDVQGEGSYVVVKSPTVEDIKGSQLNPDANLDEKLDFTTRLISKMIIEWNWVDDNGEPLPEPSIDVIAQLPVQEITFLSNALGLESITDQKN